MAKLPKERLMALRNEITMAEKLNHEVLEPLIVEALGRYTGHFIPDFGAAWDIWLNEVYPIIQNELPSILFRTPRAFLKPRNKTFIAKRREPVSGKMEETQLDSNKSARTQENILNYSVIEMRYKREGRKALLDALLFPHAILWHGYKGNFGMTAEKSLFIKKDKVFVKRIAPLRFIKDPSVTMSNIDEGKWVGRIMDIPLNDILEDKDLDVDRNQIKGFTGFGDKLPQHNKNKGASNQKGNKDIVTPDPVAKTLFDISSKEFQESRSSRFVKVVEVYLRPTKQEISEGKKGKILLLTDEQDKPLRENDWTIKAEGFPSKILAFNELNDSLFDLADIEVYSSIADQKNIITNLQIRNAQENSKVWVGISKEGCEEDIEKIREGDNSIVFFESGKPQDKMFVSSPGGTASSELYLIDGRIQKNLEDKSGVTDLKRGFLQSGEESAASVKLRAAGGGARPAYRQDLMADFLIESFTYINQLNKQFMPIKEAVRIIGSLDIVWSDNPTKEEIQADVDVEIDVVSMLPENPEKELRELNTVLALMTQTIANPAMGRKIMEEGKTFNLTPIIEQMLIRLKIRDPEVFRNRQPNDAGFVSVNQLKEARSNVDAVIKGEQAPFPPKPEDDHLAKLSVYASAAQLLQQLNQVSEALNTLIQVQSLLLQQAKAEQGTPGQKVPSSKVAAPTSSSVIVTVT